VVAARLGRASPAALAATAWTALALLAGVAAALALPLAVAAEPLARGGLRVPPALAGEAAAAARWIALAVPFAVLTGGLRGLLEAKQAFGVINALRVPLAVATYVGPLAATLLLPPGRALVWSVALVAAARVLFALAHAVACWRALPWLRVRPHVARADARELLAVGGWLSVSNVLNPVLVTLDRLALGTAVSAAALGYYTGAYEVAIKLQVVTGGGVPGVLPGHRAGRRGGAAARRRARGRVGPAGARGARAGGPRRRRARARAARGVAGRAVRARRRHGAAAAHGRAAGELRRPGRLPRAAGRRGAPGSRRSPTRRSSRPSRPPCGGWRRGTASTASRPWWRCG
jgi:hypothetical protein